MKKVSVIIPCFNDGSTLKELIKAIKKSTYVGQVIVVDDGSNVETKNYLCQLSPEIKIITHPRNLGKSMALKTGLLKSTYDLVVFLDADLINFKPQHLNQLVLPVQSSKVICSIGEFDDTFTFFNKIGQTVMLSGLRCFNKSILLKNLDLFDNNGYLNGFLIESRLNYVFLRPGLFAKVRLTGLTQKYKWQKPLTKNGGFSDLIIIPRIFSHIGLFECWRQLYLINRTEYAS